MKHEWFYHAVVHQFTFVEADQNSAPPSTHQTESESANGSSKPIPTLLKAVLVLPSLSRVIGRLIVLIQTTDYRCKGWFSGCLYTFSETTWANRGQIP